MNDYPARARDLVRKCWTRAHGERTTTRDVAVRLVNGISDEAYLRFLAAEFLVTTAASSQRRRTLDAERRAVRTKSEPVQLTPAERNARLDAQAEIQEQYSAELVKIVNDYTARVRMTWERELLDSILRLRDGTEVTWGDATVEQHEERASIFMDHMQANAEGAARHKRAIEDLRKSGACTLNEMVRAPART